MSDTPSSPPAEPTIDLDQIQRDATEHAKCDICDHAFELLEIAIPVLIAEIKRLRARIAQLVSEARKEGAQNVVERVRAGGVA